ncbi:alpha/beta hydrolase [Endozoicomonas sp. G2_1]|uniref:alpha/beta fold hydrolase n=1 Tax=Endozoicomonas sp. G2_1 TaxID=2821091 RepID=UPI001ADB9C0E|nr:alpha/beta hydrolase [Endozoicomonas sp. G2_1]MBO9488904.1 alpha/beta hydrolase [Endozoicomonas sp. G2_1]
MKILLHALLLFPFTLFASEKRLVEVNGFNVEYQVAGSGEHVVVLEAGGGASLSDWDPVYETISSMYKTIRYSRVGNGKSSKTDRHFTSDLYAQHLKQLLDILDVNSPFTLVAHSYGGSIARDFAALYPEKLSSLLLVEPSSKHDVDILRAIDLEKGNKEIEQIKLDDMKNGMSNIYLDFWSKRPLPDYPHIPDIPLTVIVSVKTMKPRQTYSFHTLAGGCGENYGRIGRANFLGEK